MNDLITYLEVFKKRIQSYPNGLSLKNTLMELTDIATLALNHMNEIQIERNLKQFISKRLQDIQENRTSHIKFSDPSFIMHLIPQSFLEGKSITINLSGIESKINQLQPLSCRGYNYNIIIAQKTNIVF